MMDVYSSHAYISLVNRLKFSSKFFYKIFNVLCVVKGYPFGCLVFVCKNALVREECWLWGKEIVLKFY